MHESDHDQKPSRKRKCRNEQRAHAHTISETRERISNNGRTHGTHTRHREVEEHATKGESKNYTSTSNSCCVSRHLSPGR